MTEDEGGKGCNACGWTLDLQNRCHYDSHIKLFYGAGNRGVWSIGSDLILKDRPDGIPKTEVETLKYLASHTNIPVPKVVRDWVDRDERYFVLEERVDGQTLEKAWPSLSESQKKDIADQVSEIRKQLCSLTSTSIQTIDQGPCYPKLLFFDGKPHGPFNSDSELWDDLFLTFQEKSWPQQVLENLRKRVPKCEPYVLTHSDLNLSNIMVKDGKLAAILDWESAAYYPIWYEWIAASWAWTKEDAEWKKLLLESLDKHQDAMEFWEDLLSLRPYPNLNEEGLEVLKRLSSEQ
ncbi:uncharacterized protein PFLUO_LOCUS5110 [Penicillium psychrofluorescens]|uniref:uncharacterized protein n=1 Tax=Penicillium psychrofluorescens TaxID=3158075 RepID=UPI003CCE344F